MKTVALGDVVSVLGGGTPRKSEASYYGGGIPWVTPKDMKRFEIRESQVTLSEAGVANSPAKRVPVGSTLVVVRSGVLKHTLPVAITDSEVTLNQDMKALVPKAGVDSRFLARFLKAMEPTVLGWVRATTADNVPISKVLELPLRLPPEGEQRRIAAILDHADAARAKRRQVLAHLDALPQAIFHEMFGNPLHGGSRARLGDLARIVRGASPRPAGDPRYFGGHIPWLKISDITASRGSTVRTVRETVTEAGASRSVRLPENTLILTNSATVGVAKIVEPSTCIHDGFLAFLDIHDRVDVRWLQAALAQIRQQLVDLAPEGTQKNLNGPIVKAVEISVPTSKAQESFVKRAATVADLRVSKEHALRASDELFAALQSRAFRGEL